MFIIIHSHIHTEKICLLFICYRLPPVLYLVFLLSGHTSLPHTSNTSRLFPCHPGTPPFPNLLPFLLFISSLPALLLCSPFPAPSLLPFPSAANGAAHLLCQEVWSQRKPGDSEPAGRVPVWTVSPGNAEPELILGERVRRARWRGQSVGHAAHVLPLLLTTGPGQSCRLAAGKPKGSQLQVGLANTCTFTCANTFSFHSPSTHATIIHHSIVTQLHRHPQVHFGLCQPHPC